jgi:hypothetical protein
MFLPATDDDVPGIVTLMNRAYRGAGAAGWSTQEAYLSADRITEDVLRRPAGETSCFAPERGKLRGVGVSQCDPDKRRR